MHQPAAPSEAERRHLIDAFLDTVFDGPHSGSHQAAALRASARRLAKALDQYEGHGLARRGAQLGHESVSAW